MNNYAHYHNCSEVNQKRMWENQFFKMICVVIRRLIKTMGRRRLRVLKALGA